MVELINTLQNTWAKIISMSSGSHSLIDIVIKFLAAKRIVSF